MSKKINLNLSEIDTILELFYKDKISITKINKTKKISPSTIKKVIQLYSEIYLEKNPTLRPIDNITADMYKEHINKKNNVDTSNSDMFE